MCAQLWSLPGGERLATLEGVRLPATCNGIYVSDCQRLMFLYSAPPEAASGGGGDGGDGTGELGPAAAPASAAAAAAAQAVESGSVKVFDLLHSRQVAAVKAPPPSPALGLPGCAATVPRTHLEAAAAAALQHVTALFYDERTHRLHTGTAGGRVQAWGL